MTDQVLPLCHTITNLHFAMVVVCMWWGGLVKIHTYNLVILNYNPRTTSEDAASVKWHVNTTSTHIYTSNQMQ